MATVRVLHESQVSPSPALASQPPQPLSFLDTMWLQNSQLVERLFFYNFPHPSSHFIGHILPIFTRSLSLTLHHYYPLAGSIRPSPDSDDQFEIVYTEGDSVALTVVELIGDEFGKMSGHRPRNLKDLRLLVPKPAKPFPPISIQVTIFPNQGLCIGFTINHAACDGSGSMQFIRSWAAACRLTDPIVQDLSPPFLNRSIVVDTHGIEQTIFRAMRQSKEMYKERLSEQSSRGPISDVNFVAATFTLSKDRILMLKERVQGKEVEGKPLLLHISAFVVTCAYVWRCLAKAWGCDEDIRQCFVSAVDWRSRMRPPFPSNYFGNCLGICFAVLKAGEVVAKGGFEAAAMEIGKSIDWLRGRELGEVLQVVIGSYVELQGSITLSVAGSPKLRVYETDFGWGRPVKVEITSIVETGALSLAESGEEEGAVEIGLVLSEEEMSKFETNFVTGLI